MMGFVVLMVPGRLETATGGYAYDRRIVAGLRDLGWSVAVRELDESFPAPTDEALQDASRALAMVADDGLVLIDGLACGAMPEVIEQAASRVRIVALVHHPLAAETGIDPIRSASLMASERRSLAAVRRVVVTSRATAAALQRYDVSEDRIAVIEPGTDPAPLAAGSRSEVLQMLCVASLIPRKGHQTLFRALASMRDQRWRLTCVGSLDRDPLTVERLRTQLKASGLEDRVHLVGEADAGALAAHYYAEADLFVLPTEYEGYGMAVAEALAHGLPVISTPTGAIADLVNETAGLLVPRGDAAALTAALSRVASDPGFRAALANGARRMREQLPRWETASIRMADVLDQVAAAPDFLTS
jgi:glycosyltransferase involved in cell wall biosynthesis